MLDAIFNPIVRSYFKKKGGDTSDTVAIDYSNFENGTFTETLETGDTLTYTVTLDDSGQPTKITAPDGTETAIDWGEG